jgi:hypothetical protein
LEDFRDSERLQQELGSLATKIGPWRGTSNQNESLRHDAWLAVCTLRTALAEGADVSALWQNANAKMRAWNDYLGYLNGLQIKNEGAGIFTRKPKRRHIRSESSYRRSCLPRTR